MTERPPRRRVRLQSAPRKGEVYWCDYPPPECLHLPEFWKRRPVVIVSRYATLRGVATVVPITSRVQLNLQFSVLLRSPIDGRDAWAICNHVTTVAVSRLLPSHGRPSVSEQEYREILQKVTDSLAEP
ncbi:MAG: type II toxin-antitoxin system PemK/MazF family toxin [Rhodobacteraceae bacterium]|nr:type II toxin-antitoxin system PemK/MazF family toxin [Paracoccaceae bacterium]MCY4137561.1 type II toxin-antitoxin system PemK/MazF family toxin [Paracoccaceae bacterium]